MCPLEDVSIPILYDLLQFLYLPALVGAQRLQVDLLEDLTFHLFQLETDGCAVDLGTLAPEGVAEIIDELIGI
jgi:hypothetical protein